MPYNSANKELVRKASAQRTQFKFRRRQVFPLFKDFQPDTSDPRSGLLDLYREEEITALCRGKKVGQRKARIGEVCKLLDHGQPALRLAPFKLSTLARTPFVARIQGFLSEAESQHLKMLGRSCLKPRIFVG